MESHHPDIQSAADGIMRFCVRWSKLIPRSPTLVVIQGESGCGKTHIAKRVAKWARFVAPKVWSESAIKSHEIPRVQFIDWMSVCSPEKVDDRSFMEMLHEIDGDSLTILDDVGAEADRFRSGVHIERLCMVLNRRERKFTLITTNHPPEHWSSCFDARVSDRMQRDSLVIEMRCPSFTTIT